MRGRYKCEAPSVILTLVNNNSVLLIQTALIKYMYEIQIQDQDFQK
jgi:hypothetical protein